MWIEQAVVELIDTGSSGWEVETWEERLEWWGGEGGGGVVKVVVVGLDPAFSQLAIQLDRGPRIRLGGQCGS